MTIKVGSQDVQAIYVGSTPVQAVYVGSTKIWPAGSVGVWTATALPYAGNWIGLCYGNGKFVAVSAGENKAIYSTDGISWQQTTLPSAASWSGVAYGNGKFVAVAADGDLGVQKAAYSTDGITWTAATLPKPRSDVWYPWKSVAYGAGKFVAICFGLETCATSTDGVTWTAQTLPTYNYYSRIRFVGDRFVITVQQTSTTPSAPVLYSTDGLSWTITSVQANGYWNDVMYDGTKYILTKKDGYPLYSYDNCATWTLSGEDVTTAGDLCTYGGGYYSSAGVDSLNRWWSLHGSTDGITAWPTITRKNISNSATIGLTYGAGKHVFIVGGESPAAWYYDTGAST